MSDEQTDLQAGASRWRTTVQSVVAVLLLPYGAFALVVAVFFGVVGAWEYDPTTDFLEPVSRVPYVVAWATLALGCFFVSASWLHPRWRTRRSPWVVAVIVCAIGAWIAYRLAGVV